MTDRKLKKLITEKPYLIDEAFQISRAEADRMIKEYGPVTIEEMLIRTRKKEDWSPEFEHLIRQLIEKTASARWNRLRVRLQTGARHTWDFHARAVVTWVLILLVAALMLFTPVGKAVADAITRYIVEFREGYLFITSSQENSGAQNYSNVDPITELNNEALPSESPEQGIENDSMNTTREYATVEEFIRDTGLHLVYLPADHYNLCSLTLFSGQEGFGYSEAIYTMEDEIMIFMWQEWGSSFNAAIIEDTDDEIIHTIVFDDIEIVGYYDAKNGEFNASAMLPDSVLGIGYAGDIDYHVVLDSLIYE